MGQAMRNNVLRPLQEIVDDVRTLLGETHQMDNFEIREFLGMMFADAVVTDCRSREIPDPTAYLLAYQQVVMANLSEGPMH